MTVEEIKQIKINKLKLHHYEMIYFSRFDYSILNNIMYHYRPGRATNKKSYNDVIIMADTETSKKSSNKLKDGKYVSVENHVVAWTISLRAYHQNIVTLYGVKPSDMIKTIKNIQEHMQGNQTIIYFHNLAYDWWFLRKFIIKEYGHPVKQLNVKPHYPILIQWDDLIIKDSLILAQRKLEKWAIDMNVEHQKAVGCWDYDKIRHQKNMTFTADELKYIENDTLAGVECIDATMSQLGKNLGTIPYTATGIPREQVRKKGKEEKAHDAFVRMAPEFELQQMLERVYHGGYTHANRYLIGDILTEQDYGIIKCYDFASSYPYSLIAYKYPSEAFTECDDMSIQDILNESEEYAFIFKLIMLNVDLKDANNTQMPALQFSKCTKIINAVLDNGRVLAADYVEIYLTEIDLQVIASQYKYSKHICTEVYSSIKDWLPKWFTDYIYECFKRKTLLKGGDSVAYALAKAIVNSLYGMCVQKPVKDDIVEDYDTGEYFNAEIDFVEKYNNYVDNRNSVLPYCWGVYCTAYAFRNLFRLGACADTWIYSDTDSCYAAGWNIEEVNDYNNECKRILTERGYGAINFKSKEYWLGVAETSPEDEYIEFRTNGAKRYCGRCKADNELHLTVAGVPKKSGAKCLKDDIKNFEVGFIFNGNETGKRTHIYNTVSSIYIDKYGNETGDSIDLLPCDYLLDATDKFNFEELITNEIEVQVYEGA